MLEHVRAIEVRRHYAAHVDAPPPLAGSAPDNMHVTPVWHNGKCRQFPLSNPWCISHLKRLKQMKAAHAYLDDGERRLEHLEFSATAG